MTKINARSPIYLNYGDPLPPAVTLDCDTAKGESFCTEISQRGIVTLDTPDFGYIVSYTSSDSGFANGKFADVTTDTVRTIVVKIKIPDGFANSSDGYLECSVPVTQPAFVAGTTCTSRIVPNGSMSNVSIAKDGASSTTQSTAGKFTLNGDTITEFTFQQSDESLFSFSTSVDSGTDLNIVITSNAICGTGYLQVIPTVSDTTSCQAVQQIQVDVTGCGAFACTDAPLSGGKIDPDGTISTKPTSAAFITTTNNISSDASGSPLVTSVAANSTGSPIDRVLYYKLTIPPNFSSAGGDKWCAHTITQQSTSTLPAFTYADARHYNYGVEQDGTIKPGEVIYGTIKSFDPVGIDGMSFPIVQTDTTRQVDFVITSPNDAATWSNPNTDITERVSMVQPADTSPCGTATNTFFISAGFSHSVENGNLIVNGICGNVAISTEVKCSVTFDNLVAGAKLCTENSNLKDGKGKAFVVSKSSTINNGEQFPIMQVILLGSNGVVSLVSQVYCFNGKAYGDLI